MKLYVDKSEDEYSIHCMQKEDLLAIHKALNQQVREADTVKAYLLKEDKKRIFNILNKIENEISID